MNEKDYLVKFYEERKEKMYSLNTQLIFSIIQIKKKNFKLKNFNQSIYLDVKEFAHNYINSVERKDFGYDTLDISKLESAINSLENPKERNTISIHIIRELHKKGLTDEVDSFKSYSNKIRTQSLKSKSGFKNYLNLISHLCSYNLRTISILLLLCFIGTYIILLPAPFSDMAIFKIYYFDYSNSFCVNHFLNLLVSIFDLEDEKFIKPLNGFGVIILSFLKLTYILLIANYLYKQALNVFYAN